MADPRPPDAAIRSVPPVVYSGVEASADLLEGVANRTPVLASRTVDERVGGRVFFKCENFQRMGAFKFRGAYNAISRLSEEQKRTGVLAYSSGNHAQAVALSGRLLGIRTTIVMPADAPAVKLAATRGYGAEVVEYDRSETTREELGAEISRQRGLSIISPYDHPDVIAGQGTTAKELFEEVGALDLLLVCCGGVDCSRGVQLQRGPSLPGAESSVWSRRGRTMLRDPSTPGLCRR